MVQAGLFGPMFYGLADDEAAERWWVGQPLVGIEANLDYARDLIAGVQAEGASYIGTMSMSWHYGDHESNKGLWQVWDRLWSAGLLGEAPCARPDEAMQIEDGAIRSWPIEDRPYRTYSGCYANPLWRATLRPMIRKAIELGVDGFNVHHGFENPCACEHCRRWVWEHLSGQFSVDELAQGFGAAELPDVTDPRKPSPKAHGPLRQRLSLEIQRAGALLRKEAFDDLFVAYGRSVKPDLLLAQWYHKYDFGPQDERSLLPEGKWASDESYLWYSQGSQKGVTFFDQGWLADMGLPARFLHAAADGRPFIINKYDWQRWRLSIAEMAAHGGSGLAVHWTVQDEGDRPAGAEDRYRSRVYPYHRFLADHEDLYVGAQPYAELALVYPRRGEVAGDGHCTDALRRIGRVLENEHFLFDIILDEQLTDRGADYDALILPQVERLSPSELALLRLWLERDGRALVTGAIGTLREDGRPRSETPFDESDGHLRRVEEADWCPTTVEVEPGPPIQTYPPHETDEVGQHVVPQLDALLEERWLTTDAPWFVRVRAWRTADGSRLCVHWLNYRQVENLEDEVPLEQGPFDATVRLPAGTRAERVDWLDPETEAEELDFERDGGNVRFSVPQLLVYGIAVIHLKE